MIDWPVLEKLYAAANDPSLPEPKRLKAKKALTDLEQATVEEYLALPDNAHFHGLIEAGTDRRIDPLEAMSFRIALESQCRPLPAESDRMGIILAHHRHCPPAKQIYKQATRTE